MSDSVSSILEQVVDKIEFELKELYPENLTHDSTAEENASLQKNCRSSISQASGLDDASCRICYDSHQTIPIVFPCKCKGTIGAIHLTCLEQWLEESNRNSCELCGYEFQVERTPRYRALESIAIWLCLSQPRQQTYSRNLHSDLLRCIIVSPLTVACTYVCIVAADFYSQNNYENFPPARWTTYSLLAMMSLIIFSYFAWMYSAIEYHQKSWFHWWQKSSHVKVTLPMDESSNQFPIKIVDKYI